MNPFNQVQSWPTPEMFIRLKPLAVVHIDTANAAITLPTFTRYLAIAENGVTDNAKANVSLVSFVVPPPPTPIIENVSDSAKAAASLFSFVEFTQISQSPSAEAAKATAQLLSMVEFSAVNRNIAEAANASVGLIAL